MSAFAKFFLLIVSLLILSFYLFNFKPVKSPDNFFISSKNILLQPFAQKDNLPQQLIDQEVATQNGTWAIAIKNLKTNKTYSYNENQKMPAASIYKLATMWTVFDRIKNGELTEDEELSGDTITLENLIDYGNYQNLEAQTETEVLTYTIKNALQSMITVSDNYAAILLSEKIGWENIEFEMKNHGFDSFDLTSEDAPTVTAKSVMNLLDRIYAQTAVTKDASDQMKKLLLSQKINDRIPKYLPSDVKVAHKTGELDNVRHDAGIVYGQKGDYIFVFLTETPAPGDTTEEIAQFSKKIYDALEQ